MLGSLTVGSALAFPALAQERGNRPERPERPKQTKRGVTFTSKAADSGFTLFTPLKSKNTYLVDARGEIVHTWASEHTPGNSVYLLPDGSVLRCAKDAGDAPFTGGGEGGRIQRIGWDGELLWDYAMANETWRHHHDIEPMPNGHVLAIVWEGVGQKDAMRQGRDRDRVAEQGLWPDAIIELAPKGKDGAEVVWEWHAWDHLVQDRNEEFPNYGSIQDHPRRIDVNFDVLERPKTTKELEKEAAVDEGLRGLGYLGGDEEEDEQAGRGRRRRSGADWMHTNSIDYEPTLDLVAISVRSASEVWIIDHSTTTAQARTGEGGQRGHGGDLCYRFGHAENYAGGSPRLLFNQHDARFVYVDGALHMTVFNNGSGRPGGDRSSMDEFSLPFSAEAGFRFTEAGLPSPPKLDWTWDGGETVLYNGHISGAQRLASGSTLMTLGEDGRTIEVSRDGEILWDWLQPIGNDEPGRVADEGGRRGRPGGGGGPRSEHAFFRATRYAADHPGLKGLSEPTGK